MRKTNKRRFSVSANRRVRAGRRINATNRKVGRRIMASMDYYTENLADFGMREIEELRDILDAWLNSGLPDDFYDSGVRPAFNRGSGYVFLVNDDYQVAVEVDGRLESFYTTPYSGYEGVYEDLVDEVDESWDSEDIEYLRDLAEYRGDSDTVDMLNGLLENEDFEEE